MTDIPGLPARRAALKLLDAVLRRGLPLESALSSSTRGIDSAEDRALARAIAAETLRHLPDLDAMIDGTTRNRLADDAKARMVLRIALVQRLVLGTPDHAAIATALPLLEGGPRRLVHGVIGTLFRGQATLPAFPTLPDGAAMRWQSAWGDDMIAAASEAIATPPPVDLTLRDVVSTDEWAQRLGGISLAPGHVRLDRGTAIHMLPGYDEGAWWVQNIAASMPARVLGAGEGCRVLDLCAAPGGKTMQLAANGWAVTAVDSDRARLVRLQDNLTRTRLSADIVQADILTWAPREPVDAIMLDAPCSATGIFARHPDVLHRVRSKDIEALALVQTSLITRVADWLKPGGTLIYATCSLEPQEGEGQMAAADAAGLAIQPITHNPFGIGSGTGPALRILPKSHADGFFIARFTKR